MMRWISLRTSDVHIKIACSVRWRSLGRPLSRGRSLSIAVCAIVLSLSCAQPRARPESNPLSTAWPELPAQCHNPDDYVRCAQIRRDQALAHRVPMETAAREALLRCRVSCTHPHGPPAPSMHGDSGLMLCCDPALFDACVRRQQDDLIARGADPSTVRHYRHLGCVGGPCRTMQRSDNVPDGGCADLSVDVPVNGSLREYYREVDQQRALDRERARSRDAAVDR